MIEEKTAPSIKPLRIWGIFREALRFPWRFRRVVGSWILIASVCSMVSETVGNNIVDWLRGEDEIRSKDLVLYTLFKLIPGSIISTVFAILCHRLVLLGEFSRNLFGSMRWTNRELRFLVLGTGMYITVITVLTPLTLLLTSISSGLINVSGATNPFLKDNLSEFMMLAFNTGYAYLIGRYSLIFPAIAVDFFQPTLGWAWSKSIGNGWRLAILVGAFPILVLFILRNLPFLGIEQYPLLLSFVQRLLVFLTGSIEIAVLSICFREICDWDKQELT